MESLEAIKTRIQSIESTRQITQSMRLVSTSRVNRARSRMEACKPFLRETERLLRAAAENVPDPRHPYLGKREGGRAAVIVLNGDRGLCGGYNINVNRRAAALIKSLGGEAKIITIGAKSRDFCRRRYRGMLEHSFIGISEDPAYDNAAEIAAIVRGWYDGGDVNGIYIVYSLFESTLVQTPTEELLLPLSPPSGGGPAKLVRCEPGGGGFLTQTAWFYIAARLFGAMLESSACEQSARVVSMDAAVKNADEMIDKLTLSYNQARQGAITQDLIEIISGADAV